MYLIISETYSENTAIELQWMQQCALNCKTSPEIHEIMKIPILSTPGGFYEVYVLTFLSVFLTHSVFKEHHVIIAANDTVPTAINTTEQIGDEVTLHYRVRNN